MAARSSASPTRRPAAMPKPTAAHPTGSRRGRRRVRRTSPDRSTRTVAGAERSGTGPARNRSTLATARSQRWPAPSVSVATTRAGRRRPGCTITTRIKAALRHRRWRSVVRVLGSIGDPCGGGRTDDGSGWQPWGAPPTTLPTRDRAGSPTGAALGPAAARTSGPPRACATIGTDAPPDHRRQRQECPRGPLRTQPAHPRPDRPAASVREAGARQMINHRGPEFAAMLDRILTGMRPYFGTTSDIAILTAAGTGGLEAAVVNTISPGDRVLGVSIGSFGDRFAKIARTYGADVTKIDVEWGQAADPAALRAELERDSRLPGRPAHPQRDVDLGHEPDRRARRRRPRDSRPTRSSSSTACPALGAVPFEMDAWGVDVVVTGSQKAWMSAPGLAMIAASPRAWAAMETANDAALLPRPAGPSRRATPTARRRGRPAIAVVYQVDEGIRLMTAEGAEHVFARHEACAAATRAGLTALGFELLADPRFASRTVTGALRPRRSRLEGVQHRAQAPRPRPRRRPGQADRQDLPARPPRVGHARGDPRRDERPRVRLDRLRA